MISEVLWALVDLVLPRVCVGCRVAGASLCSDCRQVLAGPALGRVRPTPCPRGLPPVWAFLPYEGLGQRLLLSHKEHGGLSLTQPLGRALAAAALGGDLPTAGVVVCPVPSAVAAVRARGHDHALRLARAAAGELRRQGRRVVASSLLTPARVVADQSGLSIQQRAANLAGAMVSHSSSPRAVLVVDDVMTTGATLVEATRALRAAGHRVVGAAVVAATTRQRQR